MSTIRDIRRQRLLLLLDEHKGVKKALAAAIGKAPAQVSQWINEIRTITEETAREIEKASAKPVGWLDIPIQAVILSAKEDLAPEYMGAGSDVRQEKETAFLQRIKIFQDEKYFTWEAFLSQDITNIPSVFCLEMPDDSMGPACPKGTKLVCETGERPIVGHGVLVRDMHGDYYIRRYTQGTGGRWHAQATTAAYASMSSDTDKLVIIATVRNKLLDGAM